jgi:hypothetical protein
MNKTSKRPMFFRAGKAFVRANMRVRKLLACLIKRNDGPIRMIRDTLKMVGENGKTILLLLAFSKIIPLF